MPSKEILRDRNCIHLTVILHFYLESISESVRSKNFRTKPGKPGLYNYIT